MLTGTTAIAIVLIVLIVVVGVLLAMWRVNVNKRIEGMPAMNPASMAELDQATLEPGEEAASMIGEQIESMVRAKLAAHPDLADAPLDFGTGPDGSLVIWFRGQQYVGIEQVPEARLQEAIRSAVQTFNRTGSGGGN